jgi:hypothetical protein
VPAAAPFPPTPRYQERTVHGQSRQLPREEGRPSRPRAVVGRALCTALKAAGAKPEDRRARRQTLAETLVTSSDAEEGVIE